jgi:hypothetical protein
MAENLVSTSTITRDNLFSGAFPVVTKKVTILSGQNVVRGTVMGKIDLSGKYVKSLAASIDGSEIPIAILVRDVDASLADKSGEVYLSGQFNKEKITLGTGHTVDSVWPVLRDLSIFLEEVEKE